MYIVTPRGGGEINLIRDVSQTTPPEFLSLVKVRLICGDQSKLSLLSKPSDFIKPQMCLFVKKKIKYLNSILEKFFSYPDLKRPNFGF